MHIKMPIKSKLLVMTILLILVITAHAQEKPDINSQVNELIEEINKNRDRHDYSKEIEALKNSRSHYDPGKDLSSFQKIEPQDPAKEVNKIFKDFTIEEYKEGASSNNQKLQLYYFISFSMPEQSIKNAIADAEKMQAIIALRGMKDDSMRDTLKIIKRYIGEKRAQFQINPVLFQEFDIDIVPALALIEPPECHTCGKGRVTVPPIFGDVSISYALKEMKKYSPKDVKSLIDEKITKLKGDYYEK